jgi:hypothetical protein
MREVTGKLQKGSAGVGSLFSAPTAAARLLNRLRGRRMALSIQSNALRIQYVEKGRVVSWAQVPFNPGFLRNGFVSDPQGMSRVIRNAVIGNSLPAAPVAAAFPGHQSVVRVLQTPRSKDVDPTEVVPREARRLMAYAPDEQDLFWQQVESTENSLRFLALAVPKAPLHAFAETLAAAGLPPERIELAPLSLVKLAPPGQTIIANMERDVLDIAIVVDSIPVLIRSLWLGNEPVDIEVAPDRLAEELNNTIAFYNDAYPDSVLPTEQAILLAGGFPVEDLAGVVSRETGHPVMPLVPSLIVPEDYPVAAMAVTAGLLMKG